MDAKYNWLIDNAAIRVTLNTVALALWIAMAVGLLELASKLNERCTPRESSRALTRHPVGALPPPDGNAKPTPSTRPGTTLKTAPGIASATARASAGGIMSCSRCTTSAGVCRPF